MRINITRSIDLEQVPEEVLSLLKEAQEKSDKLATAILNLKDSVEVSKSASNCIEQVGQIRRSLFDIDSCLSDSSTILAGYENILLNKNTNRPPTPEPVAQEASVEDAA